MSAVPIEVNLPRWVRANRYENMSGITVGSMRKKAEKGQIIEGRHYQIAPDGKMMINWREMDDWVENGC